MTEARASNGGVAPHARLPARCFGSGVLHLAPLCAYVGLVFLAGSVRSQGIRVGDDKLAHFLGFALMQALAVPALSFLRVPGRPMARWIAAAGFASLVGAGLELWQATLPHRSAEWMDWAASTLGALLGVGIVNLLADTRPPRPPAPASGAG